MTRYIGKRLAFSLVAGWVAITLNFLLPRLMPGDPASIMFANYKGQLGPHQIAALRKVFGLTDESLWQQYITYLRHLFEGNFGISLSQYPTPVTDVIGAGLPWTILLGLVSIILGFALGTLLGALSAARQGGLLDSIVPPTTLFIASFPYFFLALGMLWFLGYRAGWFPTAHAYADSLTPSYSLTFAWSVTEHLLLPAITIVIVSIGTWVLLMRNTMMGVLAEDYMTMAEAKGLPRRQITWRYAGRNALLPSVASLGLALGFIFAGQVLTESVFSYPGIGYQLLQAVNSLDYPVMQALFLLITFGVLLANLLVDIAMLFLDPRIRDAQVGTA